MTQILHSASYVWNDGVPSDAVLHSLPDLGDECPATTARRIWELLETPQTVETLCRVLRRELNVDQDACGHDVRIVLTELLREDLIQLSPDT
jgi:Coenzyme PQQ synthesis protein D (PqqD)